MDTWIWLWLLGWLLSSVALAALFGRATKKYHDRTMAEFNRRWSETQHLWKQENGEDK